MFDVDGLREAVNQGAERRARRGAAVRRHRGLRAAARRSSRPSWQTKGVRTSRPSSLIVTTGSQQALDLLGKTLISPGDKVIVEGPTFLATIQCFRLYGAELISAPIDADGVKTDELEKLIAEHKPKFVYLIPTFGNPSGAMLSLERRKKVLELAVKYQTLVVEDDPYGDLYFGAGPPPSIMPLEPDVPGSRELLAHCGSLSKVLSPGLRVGWMIGAGRVAGQGHHVQAVQRCAHQHLRAGHGRAVPQGRPHARHAGTGCARSTPSAPRPWAMRCASELGDAIAFVQPQGGLFVWARLTGAGGKVADAQRALPSAPSTKAWPSCPARRSSAPSPTTPPCACRSPRPTWRRSARAWRGWHGRCDRAAGWPGRRMPAAPPALRPRTKKASRGKPFCGAVRFTRACGTRPCGCRFRSCRLARRTAAPALRSRWRSWRA